MVFVMLASRRISGLMFVDDLVLLADNPMDLQSALDVLHEYCFRTGPFCEPE